MNTIDNYKFQDKKVLLRVDFNVPLDGNGNVTDKTRIIRGIPTIKKILGTGGAVIIMTHLGRPKGKRNDKMSLKHIIPALTEAIGQEIKFAGDCVGDAVKEQVEELKPGEILLLENLRFHKEETAGEKGFAGQLAALGDAYVNDAFATAHRDHASTAVIARFFPRDKMFGYLIETEIKNIDKILQAAKSPVTAVLGGSKVSTKIDIIEALLDKVDNLIIGGALIFTFVKARGGKIGASLVEEDFLDVALKVIEKAKQKNVNLYLPVDCIAADKFSNDANIRHCDIDKIDDGWMGLDIGEKSAQKFASVLKESASILWNGPVGVFEMSNFSRGTLEIAKAAAEAAGRGAYSLVGGGDTIAALNKWNLSGKISYISTAGGALLEYIEGKELPGIAAIRSG
ncbi:MAG: phosphoglycerate kinase [Candidatus Aminicenantes bacterium]|nr:phosphoglycerate kinase [Candidatus Aminicenantes bacterium]